MWQVKILCATFVFVLFLAIVPFAESRAYQILGRQKRVSDQRLAELETLLALTRMKGKLVTVPVGFGRIDPYKLGRKRRSVETLVRDLLNNQSSDEVEDYLDDTNIELLPEDVYRQYPVRLPE